MDSLPWLYFVEQFGAENIVPIAQPTADVITKINAASVGKVPSVYNGRGELVGFKDWQKRRVTPRLIERWRTDTRYGFGVVLGHPLPAGGVAVCIDVDTENEEHQGAVEMVLRDVLGTQALPQRVRDNSSRRAYVLRVTGSDEPITKRVLRLPPNERSGKQQAVEILGYGQQFAAAGRHPSGADLEWLDGPADSLTANVAMPVMNDSGQTVTAEQLAEIIADIVSLLPVQESSTASGTKRAAGGVIDVEGDDVARYLDAEGWTLSVAVDGARRIRSPFADEYSAEQGDNDSSVVYYSAGTGKNAETGEPFAQGHFVSLHASDAARTDQDWLREIGYLAAEFDQLPAEIDAPPPAPKLQRDKAGCPVATLPNVIAALAAPQWLGSHVVFDAFRGGLVIGGPGAWRPFRDTDYTWLRVRLEAHGFQPVGKELIRDAVHATAERFEIDTAQEWLTAQTWDGVPRVEGFFQRYFRVAPPADCSPKAAAAFDAYARACSLYAWTALAGRVMAPGVKADMMPILIGDQGCGKSTGVAAISPSVETFAELSFHNDDETNARKIRGVLVVEFAEMNGLRTRAIESIKAATTRTHDKWVPKYQEQATQYARRCLMFGTSNDQELLDDATGNRRFLPLECGTVDVAGIEADRAQLWAEARELFTASGVQHGAVMRLADEQRALFRVVDPVEAIVLEWLNEENLDGTRPADRPYVTTNEVIDAVGQRAYLKQDHAGKIRAGKALQALGYVRKRKRVTNSYNWIYENTAAGGGCAYLK